MNYIEKMMRQRLKEPSTHPQVKQIFENIGPEQKTEAWLKARLGLITCSDIASVIGKNKYCDWVGVLKKKLGLVKRSPMNFVMQRGCDLEDVALEAYEARTNNKIVWIDAGLQIHKKHKFLGGSPDGITFNGRLLEVKCPYYRKIIMGHVPEHYIPQIQALLEIYDLEVADFIDYRPAKDNPDNKDILNIVEVKRDREWFRKHKMTLQAFVRKMKDCRDKERRGEEYYLDSGCLRIPFSKDEMQAWREIVSGFDREKTQKNRKRKFRFI